MANRRRHNKLPVIGRVKGQRGRIVVEPSELHIDRQPDRVVVHNGSERRHVSVEGREHHIHVHPEPRAPRPEPRVAERPFFEFEIMAGKLMEEVQHNVAGTGVKFGAARPKYVPKLRPTAKNIARPFRGIIANEWLGIHPLKLGDAIFSSQKSGLRKLRRDKKTFQKLQRLNSKYAPIAEEISRAYEAEAKNALIELEATVRAGEVTKENRNRYFKEYKKKLQAAEVRFNTMITEMILNYRREYNGKKPIVYKPLVHSAAA